MRINNISKEFIIKQSPLEKPRIIRALSQIDLTIEKGKTFGLIGESGSGKSTLGKVVTNLLKPDQGEVYFKERDIFKINDKDMRALRKDIQIVFQMALNPLDPKRTVEELLNEPLKIHLKLSQHVIIDKINALLERVGLDETYRNKLPFQLSGGQRQRVIIARAIATEPKFLVLDEPVSALDVSMQGQIMNLLIDLKEELDLTYLFITHDLYLARKFCDQIAVMKDGFIIETGDTAEIMRHPKEEYTKKLISSFD
jgi:ABC-type oligopeptide transport system ATPase subunit